MLTWKERLDTVATRLGEPDLFDGSSNTEQETPYFDPQLTEQWLYQSCLWVLRKIPPAEIGAIGSAAILNVTASPVPQGVLKFISATIDGNPAESVDPETYLKMWTAVQVGQTVIYTVIGAQILFHGTAISITTLVEPSLSAFQADQIILPPGYDEDVINRTRTYMKISDYLPAGEL